MVIYPEQLHSYMRNATLWVSLNLHSSKPKIHDGLLFMNDFLHRSCPSPKSGLILVQPDGRENSKHPSPLLCLSRSANLYCRPEGLVRRDFGQLDILGDRNCQCPWLLRKEVLAVLMSCTQDALSRGCWVPPPVGDLCRKLFLEEQPTKNVHLQGDLLFPY